MTADDFNEIGKLSETAAVECFAQLTRFVVRNKMTAREAAKLSWEMALAFAEETTKRLVNAEDIEDGEPPIQSRCDGGPL
jgi:hypothetical protein